MEQDTFKGYDRDTLMLLAENKFNDSKAYYDSVKDILKKKAIEPTRAICSDLCDELFELDDKMNLIPSKMVSRIRRDTRFSKNKEMYRDNVWCMFMRHKNEWTYQPCMWFEFLPGSYTVGVGIFRPEPKFMEAYRQILLENQDEFRKAIKSAQKVDVVPDIEQYKKPKPGDEKIPDDLKPYYNAKYLYLIHYNTDIENLFSGKILEEIRTCIRAYKPLYKFLIKVTDKIIAEKEI